MQGELKAYELQQEFLFKEVEQFKGEKKDLTSRLEAVEKAHTQVGGGAGVCGRGA
jgi:hypothetical protein